MSRKNIIPMVILLLIIMPAYNAFAVDVGCPVFESSGTVCTRFLCIRPDIFVDKVFPQRNISKHFYKIECAPYISPEVIAETVYRACQQKAAEVGDGAYCYDIIQQGDQGGLILDDWSCSGNGNNVKCVQRE